MKLYPNYKPSLILFFLLCLTEITPLEDIIEADEVTLEIFVLVTEAGGQGDDQHVDCVDPG